MSVELPNLQGASLRQVVASGDHAAQLQQVRRDGAETQARFGQILVEKAVRSRDQTESNEMVVKRQEDQASFSAGDSMGGGNGGGSTGGEGESRSSHDGDSFVDEPELHMGLEVLDAPFDVAERFRAGLLAGGREAGSRAFRSLDRKGLAGLSDRSEGGG